MQIGKILQSYTKNLQEIKTSKMKNNSQLSDFSRKKISRKEAIKKTGYMALSTATMMILLNKNAQAQGNGNGHCDGTGPYTSCQDFGGNEDTGD